MFKNIGIQWVLTADCKKFTSDFGIRLRRICGKPLRFILKMAIKRKVVIESFPKLNKKEAYIFASTHYFDEDIIAGISLIDRNAYFFTGSTQQVEYNSQMYAAWLNGMIYVDRWNDESRKASVKKMTRILNSGSSILIYPEGGWNNSENLLINPLFSGPYLLAKETGAKIVPLCIFCGDNGKTIYFNASAPIDAKGREKSDVLCELRDSMATMMYNSIEKHEERISRADLKGDIHLLHMENRRKAYMKVKWKKDTWHDELTVYRNKNHPTPEMVLKTFENVRVTKQNAKLVLPIKTENEKRKSYDFLNYMQKNWNKKI